MSGALVNLVAKGAQDAFLTGKPEVSFFQSMYKRYTNFAQFPVELFPIGTAGANNTISLPITRKGDLLTYIWAETAAAVTTIFGSESSTPSLFRLYVGGQLIEEHDAYYANSLYTKFLANTGAKGFAGNNAGAPENNTWLPLHFSCCDEAGCALPLVALQYHDVEVRIQFGSGTGANTKYYANYIQLDTDERAAMANAPREMLITQVQRIQPETVTAAPKVDLSYFNHPVKCLLWGASNVHSVGDPYTFVDAKLNLNGVDVFDPMSKKYFSYVQPYYHSSNSSEMQSKSLNGEEADNLWMYSFALKADKYQPNGTCNFSRLDNAEIKFGGVSGSTLANDLNWFYAVNYNILRIQNGMGGVAFAN
jgi:hypothetical protein